MSFEFTFYNGVGNLNNMQKSSKMINDNENLLVDNNINNSNNITKKISNHNI